MIESIFHSSVSTLVMDDEADDEKEVPVELAPKDDDELDSLIGRGNSNYKHDHDDHDASCWPTFSPDTFEW